MKNLLIITQKVDEDDQLLGFFIEWLVRFARKFNKITILCLEKGKYELPSNIEVITLGKDRHLPKIRWFFNFYKYIFQKIKEYDAVFVHMNPIWVVLGGPLWHLMNKKIFFWYTSGGVTAKLKLAEKFADTIFTASSESFRLPSKKVIVTGHGINTELFKPNLEVRPQDLRLDLKILSVGRIASVKNYEVLIDAAKILKDNGFNFLVTMVGEAPLERDKNYEKNLKLKVKSLKLEDNFNFVGKVDHKNLPTYYQSYDLFVHLSRTGSLDKTLLEAMACGINVLSSNDSARSFLSPELVFKENNVGELAEKIESVYKYKTDGKLREYVVERHNLDWLIDKIASLITNK